MKKYDIIDHLYNEDYIDGELYSKIYQYYLHLDAIENEIEENYIDDDLEVLLTL